MAKNKKVKKSKQNNKKNPFEAGLDAEQVLADSLCDKFLKVGVQKDAIDDAFVGAFKGLSHRMLQIFKKEFVYELLTEMATMVDEEHGEAHVCNDCQAKEESGSVSTEVRNKMH